MGDPKPRRSNKNDLKLLTQSWGPPSEAAFGRSGSGELKASRDNALKSSKEYVDLRAARKDVPAIVSPQPPQSLTRGSGSSSALNQSTGSFSYLHRITGLSNINDYEKMKQIGEGTYGQVYMAKHKITGKFVAVKRASWVTREGVPITTIREVKILKMLHHPNVVQLFDIASSNNNVYLIFEYLDADFLKLLRNHIIHCMPEGQIKGLGQQLLQGIAFLHENRIMHRDIKASNLLVSKDGTLKIADFGLARELSNHLPNPQYTNRVVTLWYRSPELLLGTMSYGVAIDMWSYGCLYAEFLILQPLAPGKTEIEEMDLIVRLVGFPTEETMPGWDLLPYARVFLKSDPPPTFRPTLPERLRNVPRSAAALITNLLSLNPNARMSAKDALAHPYFSSEPLPYIAPIDFTDRRDLERQRRELEREKEKEREKERERERLHQLELLKEEQRRKRTEMKALPSWPPVVDSSLAPASGPFASLTPVPSRSEGVTPTVTFALPPRFAVPAQSGSSSGFKFAAPSAPVISPTVAPHGWLPQLANLPTAALSPPSSNDEEEEEGEDIDEGMPDPTTLDSDKSNSTKSNGKPTPSKPSTSSLSAAEVVPVPVPMGVSAPSPHLSPLSPQLPLSPTRLREDPTAFHTLTGSGSEQEEELHSGARNDSDTAHETTFHFDPPSRSPSLDDRRREAEREREIQTFSHYYRHYYRHYLHKFRKQRHRSKPNNVKP